MLRFTFLGVETQLLFDDQIFFLTIHHFQTITVVGQSLLIWRANRALSSYKIAETGECEALYDPMLPLLNGGSPFQHLAQRPRSTYEGSERGQVFFFGRRHR